MQWVRANKVVSLAVLGYAVLALGHIPSNILLSLFDKNQSVQFAATLFLSAAFGVIAIIKRDSIQLPRTIFFLGLALVIALFTSAILSGSFFLSLTGDSLRYAGIASTVALAMVALFHGLFNAESFPKLVSGYLFILFLTEVIAILQYFNLITMPGVQGNPASTFGNLDFYSAYVGTSFPLILFAYLKSNQGGKRALIALSVLSLICLRLTDAKQGYLDFLITALLVLTALAYQKLKRPSDGETFSIPVKTTILTFLLFLWLEFIFIVPFFGKAIPFVGDDPQVAIRGVLWLAGLNQFKSNPALGVGPDHYGAYYEQFRTVNSTIVLPGDSSNDAHSGPVQTLATTGVIGTLIFVLLIAYVIRALLLILERDSLDKRATYSLALFLFIYLTNAAISPIVLPHKYLFWAVCGYLIFAAYRGSAEQGTGSTPPKLFVPAIAVLASLTLFVGVAFTYSQFNFMRWGQAHIANQNAVQQVKVSPYIPCQAYFNSLVRFISPSGNEALEDLSRRQVEVNPRCYEAQKMLSVLAYNRGDLKEMRKRVYILIDLAPAQREVLDLATLYAVKAGDKKLQDIVTQQLARMGIDRIEIG
jgi:O-antigen ligase